MKDYMKEHQIDHLKYLDLEETWLDEKMAKFHEFSSNYDHFMGVYQKISE